MPNRQLQIVSQPTFLMGVCDSCNAEFKSYLRNEKLAGWEIKVMFGRHKCKAGDPNASVARNAPRS
jgi:hypothetical protein